MGLGAAMAGGNPSQKRQENDWYPTPTEVTKALLTRISFGNRKIHEPCCGDLAMSRDIASFGYEVISSDLIVRAEGVIEQDFLKIEKSWAPVIITNPPFNLAADVINHAMGTLKVDALALLLKSTFWHASSRHKLFKAYPPLIVAPLLWRPDFLKRGAPTMDCSWMIWRRGYAGEPTFRPFEKPRMPS